MTSPLDEAIWLTPAAHAELVAELAQLERSAAARPPAIEGRIRDLKRVLGRADVGDKPDDGLVEPGMTVTVLFDGEAEPTMFLLAHRGVADLASESGFDVYPPSSAFGRAIVGKFPGDAFEYQAPSGIQVRGRIVAARPFRPAGS